MGLLSFIPSWVIVVAVFVAIVMLLVRWSNNINVMQFIKENFFFFFLAAVLSFFAISIVYIHSTHDIDVTTKEGFADAVKIYYAWLANVFRNAARVTGYAIDQDWFATNSSNSSKTK